MFAFDKITVCDCLLTTTIKKGQRYATVHLKSLNFICFNLNQPICKDVIVTEPPTGLSLNMVIFSFAPFKAKAYNKGT